MSEFHLSKLSRVNRRFLWSLFIPMVAMNTLLFYMLGGWANQWIAGFFAVVSVISLIIELKYPGCGIVTMSLTSTDVVIPRGTRLHTNTDVTFITLRRGKISLWTRLLCKLRGTPLPKEIMVPVKCEHHD